MKEELRGLDLHGASHRYLHLLTLERLARAETEALRAQIDLAESGMTMLVVTHEMGFASQVADRVIFMDQGQIVEQNTPDAFFNNPQSDRTKLFLSQILVK